MIEFKADCGHTVRAKDEDAGKAVRCAYCGREAQVPQDDQDELDFLFSEVGSESTAGSASPAKAVKRSRKSDRAGMPFGTSRTTADPFAVVKKMAYVAAVLICVIFVGKKYAWPMINEALEGDKSTTTASPPKQNDRPTRVTDSSRKPTQPSRRVGFTREDLSRRGNQGVYIDAIPERTTAYYREVDSSDRGLDWMLDADTERIDTPGAVDLSAGTYKFAVALPIKDRQLMKDYEKYDYVEIRRKVDKSKEKAAKDVDEFFRPDGATKVGVLGIRDHMQIVRQYQVTVYENEWAVLTPQFVPDACSLADIKRLRSDPKLYGFDDDDVEGELEYHEVPERDWPDLLGILHRFGAIAYPAHEGGRKFLMFKIDPMTGELSAREFESDNHRNSLGQQ